MSVAQPNNDRAAAGPQLGSYVGGSAGKVATRLIDCLIVGIVALALLGLFGGLP